MRVGLGRLVIVGVAVAVTAMLACSDNPSSAPSRSSAPTVSSAAIATYSTRFFITPLDLAQQPWLKPTPDEESAHFVTFTTSDAVSRAIRILSPVVVYPPGSTTPVSTPGDYLTYLLGQADHGAQLTDRAERNVDGHKATVLTARTTQSLDGSLGCPEPGIVAAECFGIQDDLIVRLAVIDTDAGPLLVWLRLEADPAPDLVAEQQRFDDFLNGVHFATRPVESAPARIDNEYDGAYTWTITKDDALAYGTAHDQTPAGLAIFPNTLTATMQNGHFKITETSTTDVESGAYDASPGRIVLHMGAPGFAADVVRDGDGTLHLTAAPESDDGDVFVLTTEPWVPK